MKQLIKKIVQLVPLKNTIMFESAPDLSDNTKAVFDEMIRLGLNEKYQMIWLVKDKNRDTLPVIKNVKYVDRTTKKNQLECRFYEWFSKAIISCNNYIWKKRDDQYSIYLSHGSILKSVRGYFNISPIGVDDVLAASKEMADYMAYELNFPKERVLSLGYPRNDIFNEQRVDLHPFFDVNYDKLIVWYPTFRQLTNGMGKSFSHPLPIIHNQQMATKLNEYLKAKNTVIVLKPHFAQDLNFVKELNLSHIIFIDDSFFVKNKISSYLFLHSCDAMLTDYSSVYYDYMLSDRPIGLVWEDIEEYTNMYGFGVDIDDVMSGGEKIYNVEEFKTFIDHLASNQDILKEQRRTIRDRMNYSPDGKNSSRVTQYIIEKAKL